MLQVRPLSRLINSHTNFLSIYIVGRLNIIGSSSYEMIVPNINPIRGCMSLYSYNLYVAYHIAGTFIIISHPLSYYLRLQMIAFWQ